MTEYDSYALIYDQIGQDSFSYRAVNFVEPLLRRHLCNNRVLDLACGTGTAAIEFAKLGYNVVAVDKSIGMLAQAKRKATELHLPIQFVNSDMTSFKFNVSFDLVTCFFNSVNHILDDTRMDSFLAAVHRCLAPGGFFIFDLNTLHHFETRWRNFTWGRECEDFVALFSPYYDLDTRLGMMRITWFTKIGELYERQSQTIVEKGYSVEEIDFALQRAHLNLCMSYIAMQPADPRPDTHRIIFISKSENCG